MRIGLVLSGRCRCIRDLFGFVGTGTRAQIRGRSGNRAVGRIRGGAAGGAERDGNSGSDGGVV